MKTICLTMAALLACPASAQTKEEVMRELQRQNVPHAKIVLAQARLESGNMKSDFYKRTNNLFGLKKSGKYAVYKHWKYSIADYKARISSRYKGGSYYVFLTKIGYASDKQYVEKLKKIIE